MRSYFAGAAASAPSLLRPALLAAVVGLASFAAVAPLPTARAQETPAAPPGAPVPPPAPAPADAPKVDPEARTLLDQMTKAHQALTSFSATMDYSEQQGDKFKKQQAKISYQKPNKARVSTTDPETGAAIVSLSNGTSMFQTLSTEPTGYHKAAAAADSKAIEQVLGAGKAGGTGLLPLLITRADMSKDLLPPGITSLTHAPDETVAGVLCDVIKASFGATPSTPVTLSFGIGKTDHLLRRVSIGSASEKVSVSETYSDVQANPDLPPSTFVFTPAPGMKLIEEAPSTPPDNSAMYDVRLKKGATPLPFKGNDLAGKPVSLAAYKGKVVMLDFWATWCPPCREEVPNVVRTYNKYHGQGFEIVGVSLDRADDRAKLLSYIKENKMPWRQVYDGKYWHSAMAQAYGVQSIPFSVLIGRDGKILAVGDDLRGDDLEPAVKAALTGKKGTGKKSTGKRRK